MVLNRTLVETPLQKVLHTLFPYRNCVLQVAL
jgi:hypothetical protein